MSDLTPDQTEAVRRALADARVTDPIPTDVASRLDHVLEGLRTERDGAPMVVSLDARRRRRYASRMLVAAAAVVVGGFGIDAMVGHDLFSGQSADNSAGAGAEMDRDGNDLATGSAEPPKTGPQVTGGVMNSPLDSLGTGIESSPDAASPLSQFSFRTEDGYLGLMSLNGDTLKRDAMRVVATAAAIQRTLSTCVQPATDQTAVLVAYQGQPAALLIEQPQGQEQVVELYSCPTGHTGRLLRRIVVPAR